jgi:hypothetical protein
MKILFCAAPVFVYEAYGSPFPAASIAIWLVVNPAEPAANSNSTIA